MISFNKLVQNKQRKMLILAFFLTLTILIKQSSSINLTYIIKKEGEKLYPNCIAEENERYSAIGWIYPLSKTNEETPNITTKFIPTIQNDFNCKFSKQDKCNKIWAIKNWEIDENSTRTLDLILDSRWEDFPTIFTGNGGKEFKERIELPNIFSAGFSLRTSNSAEIFICEGWNPRSYSCYHINMTRTQIFLRKFPSLPENFSANSEKILDSYTAFANILSGDEWRNFIINLDDNGVLSLNDVSANRTVIQYQDENALKPIYFLMRSDMPAQWKIHQNQFIFTRTPQHSRLGPTLSLPSKNLCVALFVATCPYCTMNFITFKGGERKILKNIESTQNKWRMIKLKEENISEDKLTIFVETKFDKAFSNETEGFWAVDDVRVCHENEVKVSFLKLEVEESDDYSCQVIQHPKWRPKKLVYSKIKDFPTVDSSSNSNSIYLNWTQEDLHNQINYFITYEANDLCLSEPFNMRRIKSNGFLMTRHNDITIKNLVPYTKYNVTFSSMLHEREKTTFITTSETELPTVEELPRNLRIQVTDTQAYVSWDKVDCSVTYGHVIYSLKVTNLGLNTTKEFAIQTDNTIEISDLEPYSHYTLNILTLRNYESLQNATDKGLNINFTTQFGLAPPIRNLEIYSIDTNSMSFRYDLPKKRNGIPRYVQVMRCNPLSYRKCKSQESTIKKCKLWPQKYCVESENLIPNQSYTFMISIKNINTSAYGKEMQIGALTMEQVPAPPTNLTYNMVDCLDSVDYCHLNVSWLHPYDQNGTITAFHVVLNSTDNTDSKSIQEVVKIANKSYLPRYEYQIKYIPYSTHYELFVQSVNSIYKSNYANIHVKTADLGDHINQNPILIGESANSLIFQLPPLDHRLKFYTLTMIVQDFNKTKTLPSHLKQNKKVMDHICHNFGDTWILQKIQVKSNSSKNITIGTNEETNPYLKGNTQYCITFIVTNQYGEKEHDVVYYRKLTTPERSAQNEETVTSGQYNHLYSLLLLLLAVPIGFLLYRYLKRRRPKPKSEETKENVYESLPFEECDENCVSNETYDQLLHK